MRFPLLLAIALPAACSTAQQVGSAAGRPLRDLDAPPEPKPGSGKRGQAEVGKALQRALLRGMAVGHGC